MPLSAPPSVLPDVDLPAVKIATVESAPKPAIKQPNIIELPGAIQELSPAILMSLPPAPMPPRPAPKKTKQPRVLPTVLLTVLAVLAVQAIILAAWLLLR
jgi:hypothetical protein